ncbi:Sialidase precursor [Limihaloglobus sulfuriphilus]|uniref:exo-alpha-sialidase n=1 Tax=Limihaloglobus sulfuriphilus TaxID=1851148 RepID=A0A1Q2MCP9_9BACT|nr:exo-alpha-sialidase [Limihaloglobus sulfuriphilus]AQQ70483.1 Sialidase precursor [Limihaloglobus sulfuriphilus]
MDINTKKRITIAAVFSLFCMTAAAESFFHTTVFQQGMNGYNTFRIPSLIQAPDGTVLAICEGRKNSSSDTGDIDTVLRRSFDGGVTWDPLQVIWDDGPNTCGNPTVLLDISNGRVWLFNTHNLGQDSQTEIVNGTSDGVRTIWSCYSDDNGASWSSPYCHYPEIRPFGTPPNGWDATGPGNGIQLTMGTNSGRLIVPSIERNIQSDDNGQTWYESGRLVPGSSEAACVELSNGVLMRNDRPTGAYKQYNRRIACKSYNQGGSWSPLQVRDDLTCPVCQASTITHILPSNGQRAVVFANPSATSRIKMTVQISYNDGRSFEDKRLIYPGSSAYCSLAGLSDGNIALFYENGDGWPYHRISFAKFMPQWLKEKGILNLDFEEFEKGESLPTEAGAVKDPSNYCFEATAEAAFAVVEGSEKYDGGTAVSFTGNGKGIRITDQETRSFMDFGPETSFIIRVVFKTEAHGDGGAAGAGSLLSKDVAPGVASWWLRIQDGKVRMLMSDGPRNVSLSSTRRVNDGNWHNLVVVRDVDTKRLHIILDGKPNIDILDATIGSLGNNNDLMIGCFNGGERSFIGEIDKIEITEGGISDVLTAYDGDFNQDKIVDIRDLMVIGAGWLGGSD